MYSSKSKARSKKGDFGATSCAWGWGHETSESNLIFLFNVYDKMGLMNVATG